MTKTTLALALTGALIFAFGKPGGALAQAVGAQQSGAQPSAPETKPEPAPTATEGAGAKPEAPETKPDQPSAETGGGAEEPQAESPPASLGELTKDGFEIRATAFVPAEAVTRQSGKVSSDAIVVTLQKTAATAVCFYTLKAYVSRKLTTIPACTVHR